MHRVYALTTTPIINVIQTDDVAMRRYSGWLQRAPTSPGHPVRAAQKVLGRQDYCWTGVHRHYIWVRPFDVSGNTGTETWHWRLFVSKRGMVLEIEQKCPWGDPLLIKAALTGLDHFLRTWRTP